MTLAQKFKYIPTYAFIGTVLQFYMLYRNNILLLPCWGERESGFYFSIVSII